MSASGSETGRADRVAEHAGGTEKAIPPACDWRRIAAERLGEE
jgi:hypothetical protein